MAARYAKAASAIGAIKSERFPAIAKKVNQGSCIELVLELAVGICLIPFNE
jgi:hypothetical protein